MPIAEKLPYYVTSKAGRWVAGARSPGEGKEILLTAKQAEHEILLGTISIDPPAKPGDAPVVVDPPAPQPAIEAGLDDAPKAKAKV